MKAERPSYEVLEAFRTLLGEALWGTPATEIALSDAQWVELYALSHRQAVATIVFDAVKSLPSGPDIIVSAKWLSAVQRNVAQAERLKNATEEVAGQWKKLSLNPVVLKGLEIAALYPVPEHRLCGDVDWYFPDPEQMAKADSWAREFAPGAARDSDGCLHYKYNGVMMEHHLLRINPSDKAEVIAMNINHILKHVMVLGIGFRQFCDLSVAYQRFNGLYSVEHLRETLKDARQLRWNALLSAFLVRETGLDVSCLPFDDWKTVRGKDVDTLLNLVLRDGNFGLVKRNRFSGFFTRAGLFLRYSPYNFVSRWCSLSIGRVKKLFSKFR